MTRALIDDLVKIRADGAQAWDVREYVAERQKAEDANPWKGSALTDAEITALLAEADAVIVASVKEDADTMLARAVIQRRTLYARAVQGGELAIALKCLQEEADLLGTNPKKTKAAAPNQSTIIDNSPAKKPGRYIDTLERIVQREGTEATTDTAEDPEGQHRQASDQ